MRSTLRTLKDNKKELLGYAALLGDKVGSWDKLEEKLILSQSAISKNTEEKIFYSIPYVCLENELPANKLRQIFNAVFQPSTRFITDKIMFTKAFNSLISSWKNNNYTKSPILTKGVSYPSSLQRGMSKDLLTTDNVWLLDLFTTGTEYCRLMKDANAYIVVDTTIYEGWNRFSDEEMRNILTNLPVENPGTVIVERFLKTIRKKKYSFVRNNCRVRGAYLSAIAKILGLREVVRMENVIQEKVFQDFLSEVIKKIDPQIAFSFEGDTNARDFTPFVYAEELSLRELYNATCCIGPIREDLPLNLGTLGLFKLTNQNPTPIAWYSRPGKFPNLMFTDSKETVTTLLKDPANESLKKYVLENLLRAGILTQPTGDPDTLTNKLYEFMQEVQKTVADFL